MQLQERLNGAPGCPTEVDVAVQPVLGVQHLNVVPQRHLADAVVVEIELVLCEVGKVLADLQEALESLQQQCRVGICICIWTPCT